MKAPNSSPYEWMNILTARRTGRKKKLDNIRNIFWRRCWLFHFDSKYYGFQKLNFILFPLDEQKRKENIHEIINDISFGKILCYVANSLPVPLNDWWPWTNGGL